MRIELKDMTPGCSIEFKRKGPASFILGGILKLCEWWWDFWGWHLAIAWCRDDTGWWILEALGAGVQLNHYTFEFLEANARFYSWLDEPPAPAKQEEFYNSHIGKNYDVAVYPWTAIQYVARHFFNRRIPRLLDDSFTCWELVSEYYDEAGKPIQSKYDCPMITDILKELTDGTEEAAGWKQ